MSFRSKLALIVLSVGLIPVSVIGLLSYRAARDEVTQLVRRQQEGSATDLARFTATTVEHAVEALSLSAQALPLESFSVDELAEVMRIPFRQVGDVTAIALLDEGGEPVIPPVFERDARRDTPALEQMGQHIPVEQALALGAAVGPPYRVDNGPPRVVLAVKSHGHVVAAELSLRAVIAPLEEAAARGERAVLLDGKGEPLSNTDAALSDAERELISGKTLRTSTVEHGGEPALAAFAPVPDLNWGVLIERPEADALTAATRVRNYALFWAIAGMVLATALSLWLARSVSRPIGELSVAAKALGEGRYDAPTPMLDGNDELAQFATTFRQMALEIRSWNRELQQRVDQRTAELKAAQDQILRTRRLAALGSLGAGIAHELNNPLTAVLGLVGLVRMNVAADSPDAESLDTALAETRRIGTIVAKLKDLTEAEREAGGARFAIAAPIRAALEAVAPRADEQKVTVSSAVNDGGLQVQGDAAQMRELLGHLLDNALHAMPDGGTLDVSVTTVDGQALKVTVSDSGRGIPAALQERIFDPFFTTKDDPQRAGVGLGLSSAHRAVERFHGSITVMSEPGRGAIFTILLPAAGEDPHLA